MNLPMTRPRLTSGMNAIPAMPSASIAERKGASDGILGDVRHDDRLRIDGVRRPRRVAFDRLPIGVGQAAPGGEAHHAARRRTGGSTARDTPRPRVSASSAIW